MLLVVPEHSDRVFVGDSGDKAEAAAAADREKKNKKQEILSDNATLGPAQKTPQTDKKQMLHN